MIILDFTQAQKMFSNEDCSLLLGNGFSANYFNYKNLLVNSGLPEGGPILNLFKVLDTFDFEHVMRYLEEAALVANAYGDYKRETELQEDSDKLREALITAIRATHPLNKNDIGDKSAICMQFLKNFGGIFTLNYDLLLYWARLESPSAFTDGFGLGTRRGNFHGPFQEDAHCNVYNLHGGLHLFRTATLDVEKCISTDGDIISEIEKVIRHQKRVPLYVAEGTSSQKLTKINQTPYLNYCFRKLKNLAGNIFIYGHSASSKDEHIYEAIFTSKIHRIFFCVHTPSMDISTARGELERYKAKFNSSIDIKYIDSETVPVWSQ